MLFKIAIVVLPVFVLIALGFISSYLHLLTRHLVDSLAKFCQDFVIFFNKIFMNFRIQQTIFQHFSKSTRFCKFM